MNLIQCLGKYDFVTVHDIVNSTNVVHVSFVPEPEDPFPIVLPMIGQMGSFAEPKSTELSQPLELYLHGSISSRIMKLSQDSVARGEDGLAVCVAATKVDGLVLAHTPFHHSYNFRSAVIHGHAKVVEDLEEKMYALKLITNKVVPQRWGNTRIPPNKTEMHSTHVLRVRISSGSAKVRWGIPNADRGDLKNTEVLRKYWSGVVPVWETYGEPISGPDNKAKTPNHVTEFVKMTNDVNKRTALLASQEQDKDQ